MSQLEQKDSPLGRGLTSLFNTDYSPDTPNQFRYVPIENIQPGKYQPRQFLNPEGIQEMAQSILKQGLLQPIIVRPINEDKTRFEIIAGERRWQAAKQAEFKEVPVIVRPISDAQALEMAIVENLQRQDLSLIEEGHAYKRLVDEFGYTHEDIAQGIKKSRSYITNAIRLLNLSPKVQEAVRQNLITASHARTLINMEDAEDLVDKIEKNQINVRDTEALKQKKKGSSGKTKVTKKKDPDLIIMQAQLSNKLDMEVVVTYDEIKGTGEINIKFTTPAHLDHLARLLYQPLATNSLNQGGEGDVR